MISVKCTSCGKVLFEAELKEGTVMKKCKCGVMNTFTITKPANRPFQDRLELATK